MVKFRYQAAILFSLLIIIFALALCAVRTIEQPQYPTKTQSEGKDVERTQKGDSSKFTWEWLTKDAASFFTFILALLTTVLAFVAVIQIIYLRRSDDTARRTADAALKAANAAFIQATVAEKTLIAAHRPWITVQVEVAGVGRVSRDDMHFTFKFIVKNTGNSPALQVVIRPIIVARHFNKLPIRDFINKVFLGFRGSIYMGYTIAPDIGREFIMSCGFERSAFQTAISELNAAGFEDNLALLYPMLVGVVEYRSIYSEAAHTTTFYYDISRARKFFPSGKSQSALFYNFDETTVPMDEIRLEESMSPATEMT